jgi:hypothetical protein
MVAAGWSSEFRAQACDSAADDPDMIVKSCQCGAEHTAEDWAELPFAYVHRIPEDSDGPEEIHEYRNCGCGSSIAIDVSGT